MMFIYTGNVQVEAEVDRIVEIIKAADFYCIRGARDEFERAALHYVEKCN